ncbi:Nuclear valosin-containing protein-like, partial [Dissostichus eleginoides]
YMATCSSEYVDLSAMAVELQRLHRMDYGRRNKIAFRLQVEKVYDILMKDSGINDLENKHMAKRAKHANRGTGEGSSSSSEEDGDSDDVILEDTPINHMNSSLTSLYRKGVPESGSGSPRRDPPAASTPGGAASAPPTAGTQVSTGGWFIDKGRGPEERKILIDLCDDQTDVSMLEPEKSTKKSKKRTKISETTVSRTPNKKAKSKSLELQYPTLKFEDVGGNEETLTEVCKLLIHMRHPEVGFLLHGPPGCGKTLLAQAVAGELKLPLLKVSAPELVSGVSGESEQKLRELFEHAVSSAPCIMFIDEIDAITPKREVASKDMERRIVAQLLTCMDDLNSLTVTAQVMVIGATNRPDSLDPALRRAGRFDREICLGIPDEAARLRILKTLCRKLKLPEDFDFKQLARLTPGYVGADLMALCREAAMSAVHRVLMERRASSQRRSSTEETVTGGAQTDEAVTDGAQVEEAVTDGAQVEEAVTDGEVTETQTTDLTPPLPQEEVGHNDLQQGELWHLLQLLNNTETLSEEELAGLSILMSDFQASLASVQPSAKREGFATVPDVTWEDVGALQDIREDLTMAILAPVRSPEQFKALGLSAPSGVLLAGPPGCGKTLLAKAVANESGLNFISVKGPELLNMYVGESERAVRQVFQRGRNSAPCVIFFDEIDALCPRRSGHESGASVRVVNQLLTEMDGLETRRQVFIMAATNRPDIIDPAILRPGRLDKTLYVGLPPPADRHAILLTITKGGTKPHLEQDVSLEEIAFNERCDCFSGADLNALVREASVNALREYLKSQPTTTATPGHTFTAGPVVDIRVSKLNFEDAFKKVRPSVSKKEQKMYELLRESLIR